MKNGTKRRRQAREVFSLPLSITQLEDRSYLGRSSALPGLNACGRTIAEVLDIAPALARDLIDAMRSKGMGVVGVQARQGSA